MKKTLFLIILMVVWCGSLSKPDSMRLVLAPNSGLRPNGKTCRPATATTFNLPTVCSSQRENEDNSRIYQLTYRLGILRPLSCIIWDDDGELECLMWNNVRHNKDLWIETHDKRYLKRANRVLNDLARVKHLQIEDRKYDEIKGEGVAEKVDRSNRHNGGSFPFLPRLQGDYTSNKAMRLRQVGGIAKIQGYSHTRQIPTSSPSTRESIGGYYPDYNEPFKPKGIPFNVITEIERAS